MRRLTPCIVGLLGCAAIAAMLCTGIAHAATCEKWAGKVVSAQGVVEVKPAGETRWQAVKLNETYCPGDTIRTDRKSRADIALYNHPILRLDQNSTVTLGGMKDEKTSLVDMISGAALFFSRVTRNLEVRTATVNAGVEGTEFFIRVEEGKTDLTVFEGKVLASNAAGGLPVTTGQSAVAEAGKAPVYRVVVRPRDAVQWALYYPPVLDARPADLKEDSNDPRFFTARASQLLAVGRVDEAIADIDRAQKIDPKNSDAFALQSIIAVTQNEKAKALDLSRKAVEADPKSATPKIAVSYAQQAHFDLPGALGSMEEAVKLAPGNALAWARLAELQQSFGYLGKSLDSAQKAVALKADLSRTQTVLGFSHLTRMETGEARGAFEKAIKYDDADPLPRLGLGLAKIRDGNLEDGRREIEIAMSLDPNNSLIRSYLGKAYFEEKRDKLASGQYEMAKSLDPSDPTPHFYDAIEKQTTNRPVEALQEMEKAIQLNGNRAVYRSNLLIDQDLASRGASLARIYNDLGFQQRAMVEGWRSLDSDPANFSAHRFLSDTYSALPRHEIARVSELLQAQLLQPLNILPIQPRLSESNLFTISGGGPSDLSFNEFNTLFERNRVALLANGLAGENSTLAGEAIVSGIYGKLSGSVGISYYDTDGYRPNNDLRDGIGNLFAQVSVTPQTSFQLEYRKRELTYGDLQLRFFRDDIAPKIRRNDTFETLRLGFRQNFNPGSDLIGNFMYQSLDAFYHDSPDAIWITNDSLLDVKSYSGELSYLHNSQYVKVVTGAGYFKVFTNESTLLEFSFPFDFETFEPIDPPLLISIPGETSKDLRHVNAYLYMYFNYPKNVTFTLGGSGDFIDSSSQTAQKDKTQFNPKFGITWNPLPGTTVRAAAFKALKRTLITNQTLEPTQVAGFNQFYDDRNGTEYWRYGIGIDQKFSASLYGGAECSKRDMSVPYTWTDPINQTAEIREGSFDEEFARAYLYWTPMNWAGLSAEYMYEKYKQAPVLNFGIDWVRTQRVPMGLTFFHPSGFSFAFRGTYYDQEGNFSTLASGTSVFFPGESQFWLFDASLNYRLPKRYGFISVGAKNLFDRSFQYYDPDYKNPSIQPDRVFYAKINISL